MPQPTQHKGRDRSGRKQRRVDGQRGNPFTGLKAARREAYLGTKKKTQGGS
jgi:hypothetical protein